MSLDIAKTIVGLALEGVPVRAIARATHQPSGEVQELLEDAKARGEIVIIPKPDWPPGSPRENRIQTAHAVRREDLEAFRVPLQRVFGLTPQQARFLAALICRREVERGVLRSIIGAGHPHTVKQVASRVRTALAQHGFGFETIHDHGYAMTRATADRILVAVKQARGEEGLT